MFPWPYQYQPDYNSYSPQACFPPPPQPPPYFLAPPTNYIYNTQYFNCSEDPGQYQNESFNGAVHQLNQEPQVYLQPQVHFQPPLPPPEPVPEYVPPPPPPPPPDNNMYRGRGNWRHHHQTHFSHERDDRPYRRRRSHLDDIYLPNYEDNDDLSESDDMNNYHQERFENRRITRWDVSHKIPHMGRKRDNWRRCLTPTKLHASTSKDCAAGEKDKTKDECKDSAPDKPCAVVTKPVERTNVASDNSIGNLCGKETNNECDKIKDSDKTRCSNYTGEKDKETKIVDNKKDIKKPISPTKAIVGKISEVSDSDGTVTENIIKTDTSSIIPNVQVNSFTNTANSDTKYNLPKHNADVGETCIKNDPKQNKTDDQSATHKTTAKDDDIDKSLEKMFGEQFLVIDDDSHKLTGENPSKTTWTTPLSDERVDGGDKAVICHTLPLEFPTWEQSPTTSKYQNLFTSIREIDSDEETICYDHFITLDNIDTTKSYLEMESLGPEFDDYRVTDMTMSTPSPSKRKGDEYEGFVAKKTKYDRLYTEINSDQLLSEINEVLKENNQISESATTKCAKRYRSRSLTITQPVKKDVLPRSRSLHSIDQSHQQITYNFDVRTNLLMLLGGGQKSSKTEISGTDDCHDDLKYSSIPHGSIVKDADKQKENIKDTIIEKLNRDQEALKNSSNEYVCKENEKEDVEKAKGNEIELISNEAIQKVSEIDIDIVFKESETKKGKEEAKNEIKLEQDVAAPVKDDETGSKCGDNIKVQTNVKRMKNFDQVEPRSISNDHVSRDNGPNRDRTLWPYGKAIRYGDYKKSVDLTKKSAPPEMSLCAMMGSPKKLTSRRMTFSNENELHLQKMKFIHLFGTDFEDEETSDKCGDDKTSNNKSDNDRNGNKKRKCEKGGIHKSQPQPKKLFLVSNAQRVSSKAKSLDKARRYSTPSTNEGDREPPNVGQSSKSSDSNSNYKISNKSKSINKSNKTSSSAASSGINKYISDKRQIPMPLCSGPQDTKSSQKIKPEDDRKRDKNSKPIKGHESKTNSTQNKEMSKDEKRQLNIDVGKSRPHEIDRNSKNTGKQVKSHSNPKVVESIPKKYHRDDKDGKSLKPIDKSSKPSAPSHDNAAKRETHALKNNLHANLTSKPTDDAQNDRKERPASAQKQVSQCEKDTVNVNAAKHSLKNNLHANVTSKPTDNAQNDRKETPASAQKQVSQSEKDTVNPLNNSAALQPLLVLSRIDDQIANASNAKKQLPIQNAVESFASESNYMTCSMLAKDHFPMMQKTRFFIAEDECCDKAAILEDADVTDKMDTVKQPITVSVDDSSKFKESDDIIEVKPEIPVIDLTEDGSDVKLEDPPETKTVIKPDTKEEIVDVSADKPNATNNEERITLYRSDETLNSSLEVQAMEASISPVALRTKDGCKKPDDIKPDDRSVEATEDKTTSAGQAVSTVSGVSSLATPQQKSVSESMGLSESLIERVITEALNQREQQISDSNVATNTPQIVSASGTNIPLTPLLANALRTSTATTKNPVAPLPYSNQRISTVDSPRRKDGATSASIAVTQSPRRRCSGPDQIGFGSPHQTPRATENNADAQNGFAVSSPQCSTRQVSHITTSQRPRSTESNTTEQNFVSSQVSRLTESITPPTIFNVLVDNRRVTNSSGNQNSYPAAPDWARTENNSQVDVDLTASTGNGAGAQNCLVASQLPRGIEIATGPIPTGMAQRLRVERRSAEQNISIVAAANPIIAAGNATRVISGVVASGTPGEQNVAAGANNVGEPMSLTQSPRQNSDGVDGPLRELQQLNGCIEPSVENGNKLMERVGYILIKHLYFFDGVKRAQAAYSEHLKRMSRCLPQLVKEELAHFEYGNSVKFYKLSKDLIKELKTVNMHSINFDLSTIAMIIQSLYNSMCAEVPNLSRSYMYLLLEALIKPELEHYLEVPFLAALYCHIIYVVNHIRRLTEPQQAAAQNNLPSRDLFTPEQRRQLEWQLQQYKTIQSNQVILFSMGNTLQSSLLRAHQNNLNAKANQQNNTPARIDAQSRRLSGGPPNVSVSTTGAIDTQSRRLSGGSPNVPLSIPGAIDVQSRRQSGGSVQLYDIPGPPNVSLSSNTNQMIRNPPAPQQENPTMIPTQNSEVLKNILLSNPTAKKPGKRRASLAARQPVAGASSGSNLTVPSNAALNSTVTAPTPQTNQSDVFRAKPRLIAKTARRNSSPNGLQHKQVHPKSGTDGTNENFKIRLPFTMPYDVSASPSRTVSVAQLSPRSTVQNLSASPSTSTIVQSSGHRISMVQNAGATPYRPTTAQMAGATPSIPPRVQSSVGNSSMLSIGQNPGATPSRPFTVPATCATPRSSMVQNASATPSRSTMVQDPSASPSMPSLVQNLSMPLLDDDVPPVNVTRTPVYAPMPFIHPMVCSPSPPLEINEDTNSSEVGLVTEAVDNEKGTVRVEEEVPSTSKGSTNEDSSVKDEKKQQLANTDIETIDLTWLDDVDMEQLQNEIEFIAVKKEEIIDELIEEGNLQDPIGVAPSPTDSGISSPNVQVEYNEQMFSDRTCICGKAADYICGCRMAMYCSVPCQLKDWKSHKEVCLKHSAKSNKDTAQNQ